VETRYRLDCGRIYGPEGFTGFYIDKQHRIIGRRGYTRHWVYETHIYAAGKGNTGFSFIENRIHGPTDEPPWEAPVQ
jgi:hypothetical protein